MTSIRLSVVSTDLEQQLRRNMSDRGHACASICAGLSIEPTIMPIARILVAFAVAWLPFAVASAAELQVSNAWIRLLPGGVPAGGYFDLRNDGKTVVQLTGASSSSFGDIMVHESLTEKGQSQMRHIDVLELPPGRTLTFKPGSYHLMLMQPARKLNVGDKIPMTLEFANGERVTTQFEVRGPGGK